MSKAHTRSFKKVTDTFEPRDQYDLGLITRDTYLSLSNLSRNPITSPTSQQLLEELKPNDTELLQQTLSLYQEEAEGLGIQYTGALASNDEPTQYELEHCLDSDPVQLSKNRQQYRYLRKEHNKMDWYTRYIWKDKERIEYDDNSLLTNDQAKVKKLQRMMSDAWEEWEYETYNLIKADIKKLYQSKYRNTANTMQIEQCYLKVWGKDYWDVINVSHNLLQPKVTLEEWWVTSEWKQIRNKKVSFQPLINYLNMVSSEFRKLKQKQINKIKLFSIDKQCFAIL